MKTATTGFFSDKLRENSAVEEHYTYDLYTTYEHSINRHNFKVLAGMNHEAYRYKAHLRSQILAPVRLPQRPQPGNGRGRGVGRAEPLGAARLLRPRDLRLRRKIPRRGELPLGRFVPLPETRPVGILPLRGPRMEDQRGKLHGAFTQGDRQRQAARLGRIAREPGHRRQLPLHTVAEPLALDLLPDERQQDLHHQPRRPAVGRPDLGDDHNEKPRPRPGILREPSDGHRRFLHPRHEGHAHPGQGAAGRLRHGIAEHERRRPAHPGIRNHARLAGQLQPLPKALLLQRELHARRQQSQNHEVRQPDQLAADLHRRP